MKKVFTRLAALLAVMMVFVCCSGFTAAGDAEIYYSGKGEIAVSVVFDQNEEEFRKLVDEYLRQYRYIDQDELVTLDKIEKTEGGYIVYADFRRIDKVKCVGQFEIGALRDYAAEGSQTKWNLEYWAAQDYQVTRRVYFDSTVHSVSLDSGSGRKYYCTPKNADGIDVDVETLCKFGESAEDSTRILTFCMFLSDSVASIRVTLPGEISYYAGDAVTLDGENSFTIVPQKITAKVTVDGVTEKEPVCTAIGYVVFDRGTSPVAIAFIVIAVVVGLALVATLLIALYRAGLKRIKRLEGSSLNGVISAERSEAGNTGGESSKPDETSEHSTRITEDGHGE